MPAFFEVESSRGQGAYIVVWPYQGDELAAPTCECPGYWYNQRTNKFCRHIRAVQYFFSPSQPYQATPSNDPQHPTRISRAIWTDPGYNNWVDLFYGAPLVDVALNSDGAALLVDRLGVDL